MEIKIRLSYICLLSFPFFLFAQVTGRNNPRGENLTPESPRISYRCPEWIRNLPADIPPCPGDSRVLPENYPASAVILPDLTDEPRIVQSIVASIGRNTNPDRLPLIIFVGRRESFDTLVQTIQREISPEQRASLVIHNLRYAQGIPWPWLQDMGQAFIDPSNARPLMRYSPGYLQKRLPFVGRLETVRSIGNVLAECGFETRIDLQHEGPFKTGHYGGNIEALPGGICLLGDDHFEDGQWESFARQVCGEDLNRVIRVPTSWLEVGHTDEIVKVLPNQSRNYPCNFSVAIASPRIARELLRSRPNDRFIDSDRLPSGVSPNQTYLDYRGRLWTICVDLFVNEGDRLKEQAPKKPNIGPSGGVTFWFGPLLLQNLRAFIERNLNPGQVQQCINITNQQVFNLMQSERWARAQDAVQRELDHLRNTIIQRIRSRLPQCGDVDIVELPAFFYTRTFYEAGEYRLANATAHGFLPNPTNGIRINHHVIIPAQGNQIFEEYMRSELQKRGLSVDFVNSFSLHNRGGNIHCATNVIPICRPQR